MRWKLKWGCALWIAVAAAVWPGAGSAAAAAASDAAAPAAIARRAGGGDADAAAIWTRAVLTRADHQGLPYAVVDKRAARIAVYHADGRLAGVSPVLLGRTPGDHWHDGVGERAQQRALRSTDRTTPAGRFLSEPGQNRSGEAVVWIDYTLALAIHQLRPGPSAADRARRLASAGTADKRVSDGCVVVPQAFFASVVQPLLGSSRGVVYVLPESAPADAP